MTNAHHARVDGGRVGHGGSGAVQNWRSLLHEHGLVVEGAVLSRCCAGG